MRKIQQVLVWSLLGLGFVQLSSCAALMRYKCNREYAAKKGMEDAEAGRLSQPSRLEGNSCEGEYTASSFSKDYNYGFQQKKSEICQTSSAANFGRSDGEQGASQRPQKAKLALCSDTKDMRRLEAAYESEFLKSYCAPARATKAGITQAQAWQIADFETAFQGCKNQSALKSAFQDAYKQTLASSCTSSEAERIGLADAAAGKSPAEGMARFDRCGDVGKSELKSVFEKSFLAQKSRLEKEAADRAAAEQERARQARIEEFTRNNTFTTFPFNGRPYISQCRISNDKSQVLVDVENRHPEQVLIQGNWRVIYFGSDFNKITEDRTLEAVLLGGHSKKTFQKLTLPPSAAYCRAEFQG